MDHLLLWIEVEKDLVDSRARKDIVRENRTILPDGDDDLLDVPNLPFTMPWFTTFLLKNEDEKRDGDATQSEPVDKVNIQIQYSGCTSLESSNHE